MHDDVPLNNMKKLEYILVVLSDEGDITDQVLVDVAIQFTRELQEAENERQRNDGRSDNTR